MMNRLEVDSITLEFGSKRVLNDVYIKCETNRVVGLLGRNGSGKSCLMKIMFGTLMPNNHSIRINNSAFLNNNRQTTEIKYLPQTSFIPASLTVKRIFKDFQLDFSEFSHSFPELEGFHKTKLNKLSGGERRIVELYTILMSKSKFCILDEPFSHVMPLHVEMIKKLILRENKNKGIIVSDHIYRHIVDISDDLYLLNDGKTHLTSRAEDLETLGYI